MTDRRRTPGSLEVSLRFWSNSVDFEEIANRLKLRIDVIHKTGHPMAIEGRLAKVIAKRNYLCAETHRTDDAAAIETHCATICTIVGGDNALGSLLQSSTIDGKIWIAVFPAYDKNHLAVSQEILQKTHDNSLSLLIEDFKNLTDGNPTIHELPCQI